MYLDMCIETRIHVYTFQKYVSFDGNSPFCWETHKSSHSACCYKEHCRVLLRVCWHECYVNTCSRPFGGIRHQCATIATARHSIHIIYIYVYVPLFMRTHTVVRIFTASQWQTKPQTLSFLMGTLPFVGKHTSLRVAVKNIVQCCCVCSDTSVTPIHAVATLWRH